LKAARTHSSTRALLFLAVAGCCTEAAALPDDVGVKPEWVSAKGKYLRRS